MRNKNLLKKSGIYFIGNLSSKIMSALLIPIYAFYINAEELGYYELSKTMMGILAPIIVLAIWEAILKYVLSESNKFKQKKIISTSAIFTIAALLLFVILAFIYYMINGEEITYFGLIVTMIGLYTIATVWQYYARATANNRLYVTSGILSTVVNFTGVILLVVVLDLGLLGLILSYILGQLSMVLLIDKKLKIIRTLNFKEFDFAILKGMLIFSVPLVFNLTSAWFISGFGRLIITYNMGNNANGLYSFSNNFSMIINTIGAVVTMAVIEEAILSMNNTQSTEEFSETLQDIYIAFQTIGILSLPFISIFYEFLSSTDYSNSLIYVPGLLFYAITNTMASNVGSVFQAIGKTKYQFLTTALGGLMTFLISVILINHIGIFAVILGQIIGAVTMLISRYLFVNRFSSLELNWVPILNLYLVFLVLSIITINSHFIINLIIGLVLIGVVIYKNKEIINTLLNKLRG